jgi:hypothetical protein
MNVAPFHPDPRVVVFSEMLALPSLALVAGLALRRFLSRWLPEDDPRRQLVAQALLYGGTFIVIAVSVWLRHR